MTFNIIGGFLGFATFLSDSAIAADCVSTLDAEKTTGPELIECIVKLHDELVTLRDELKPFRDAKGAVLAFDRSGAATADETAGYCPSGWKWFEASGGRMLIGAGIHKNNVDQNGKRLERYPSFLEDPKDAIGGTEEHELKIDEIPAHRHDQDIFQGNVAGDGQSVWSAFLSDVRAGNAGGKVAFPAPLSGGGKAHNNMPPYVALYFCKKGD